MKFGELRPGDVFAYRTARCIRIVEIDPIHKWVNAINLADGEDLWFAADDIVTPLDVHFTERGEG